MFDPHDPSDSSADLDIPRCACCSYELHGADYSRLACEHCEDRMYAQLNQVEKLWRQLPPTTYRPTAAPGVGRSTRVHSGIPGNATVINLTGPGDDTPAGRLLAVEDDWRGARSLSPREKAGRPLASLRASVRFLREHLRWACGAHLNPPLLEDGSPLLPDVQLLSKALNRIVSDLTQASTGEPRPRAIPVRCFAEWDDGTVCGAEIWVGARTVRELCPGCGAEWTRETFLRLAAEANQFGAAA